jgi:hypothetical protein
LRPERVRSPWAECRKSNNSIRSGNKKEETQTGYYQTALHHHNLPHHTNKNMEMSAIFSLHW